MTSYTFFLLGPVRAWAGSKPIALGPPQQIATLAILLLRAGSAVPADEMIDALWGDEPPRAAVGTVRTYLSRLRGILGPRRIESGPGGYTLLVDPESTDLALVRRRQSDMERAVRTGDAGSAIAALNEALDQFRGVPLAGLAGPHLSSRRAQLAELRRSLSTERIRIQLDLGRHVEVLPELTAMVREERYHEDLHTLLMLALHRGGRTGAALRVYDRLARTLHDELGLDPGPQARDMHQRIR